MCEHVGAAHGLDAVDVVLGLVGVVEMDEVAHHAVQVAYCALLPDNLGAGDHVADGLYLREALLALKGEHDMPVRLLGLAVGADVAVVIGADVDGDVQAAQDLAPVGGCGVLVDDDRPDARALVLGLAFAESDVMLGFVGDRSHKKTSSDCVESERGEKLRYTC